jgi:uncharacterized repeat protein (TIGR01451 family)
MNIKKLCALSLCLSIPAISWANITNTATVAYKDAAGSSYNGSSNLVTVTTPPVITLSGASTGDQGVAFNYQISASNSPTSYSATGLPTGLSINTTTGKITGTPTVSGTFSVTLNAINGAGTGTANLNVTIHSPAVITLQKSASPSNAKSGDTVTFTLQYSNTADGDASNVVMTDAIPTGSTLVSGSITGGGTVSNGTITWTIGSVAGGATGSVTFKVTVN